MTNEVTLVPTALTAYHFKKINCISCFEPSSSYALLHFGSALLHRYGALFGNWYYIHLQLSDVNYLVYKMTMVQSCIAQIMLRGTGHLLLALTHKKKGSDYGLGTTIHNAKQRIDGFSSHLVVQGK